MTETDRWVGYIAGSLERIHTITPRQKATAAIMAAASLAVAAGVSFHDAMLILSDAFEELETPEVKYDN